MKMKQAVSAIVLSSALLVVTAVPALAHGGHGNGRGRGHDDFRFREFNHGFDDRFRGFDHKFDNRFNHKFNKFDDRFVFKRNLVIRDRVLFRKF